MSDYHYLDETGTPQGPVSEVEIQKLAEAARQKGVDLLVAKPGDSGWSAYGSNGTAAGSASARTTAPAQLRRPGQPVRPQPAGSPAPAQVPQPAPAQVSAKPQTQPTVVPSPASQGVAVSTPVYISHSHRAPWIAIACYAVAVLWLLVLVGAGVLTIIGLAGGNPELAAMAGGVGITAIPGSLISALFFAWAGKVVSLLDEIASKGR